MDEKEVDKSLIQYYIGKNSDIIYKKMNESGQFNIFSMIFTSLYFFYRKMYGTGFMLIGVEIILSEVLDLLDIYQSTIIVTHVIFSIICGFLFYPLYKSYVEKKVYDIMQSTEENDNRIKKCIQNGGTSNMLLIIVLLPFLLIIISMISIIISSAVKTINEGLNESAYYNEEVIQNRNIG